MIPCSLANKVMPAPWVMCDVLKMSTCTASGAADNAMTMCPYKAAHETRSRSAHHMMPLHQHAKNHGCPNSVSRPRRTGCNSPHSSSLHRSLITPLTARQVPAGRHSNNYICFLFILTGARPILFACMQGCTRQGPATGTLT